MVLDYFVQADVTHDNNAIIHTYQDKIIEASNQISELTGYTVQSLLGRNITKFFTHCLRMTASMDDLITQGKAVSCYIFTKSFNPKEIVITIIRHIDNNKIYMLEEVTSVKDEAFHSFIYPFMEQNTQAVGVFSVKPSFFLLKANQVFLKLTEPVQKESAYGKPLDLIMADLGKALGPLFQKAAESGKIIYTDSYSLSLPGKSKAYWRMSIVPVVVDEAVKYLTLNMIDINPCELSSKIKEAYEAASQKEDCIEREALKKAMEVKDEFISFMAHEFKTPLAVINSALQAIEYLCKDEVSDKLKGFLNKIKLNTFRQIKIVNNFLDLTRLNAGQFKIHKKNIDIVLMAKQITESVNIYAQQKGVDLKFVSRVPYKITGIDEDNMERVLLNLLSNAIKFTPKGKNIWVRVYTKIVERKYRVCIDVEDEGMGIPLEKQQMIFERFGQVESNLTRQSEGTGIGLSLVKKLVKAMNGTIQLTSQTGKGSCFTVMFPAARTFEGKNEQSFKQSLDNRLIQTTAIELSEIYTKWL